MNSARFLRAAARRIAPLAAIVWLASCGGGGGTEGIVGSGGTGTNATPATSNNANPSANVAVVARGPITGFGSIIVNGVTYDDSAATLIRDDQSAVTRADLRLGMFVELRGVVDTAAAVGTASSVTVISELRGTVQDRTATQFTLLGVTVTTTADTVFDNAADVVNDDLVEVYGIYDEPNRAMLATRIEKKVVVVHKLRGVVSNLDATARQFSVGAVRVDYSNASALTGVTNGAEVKLWGPAPPAAGAWLITQGSIIVPVVVSNDIRVEFKAVIDQFTSLANFRASGYSIDGTTAVVADGVASRLAPGVIVEIKGDLRGGILRATSIKIEGVSRSGSSGSGSSGSGSSGSGNSGSGNSGSGSSGSGSSGSGSSGSGSGSGGSTTTDTSSSGSGSSGSGRSGSGSGGSGSDSEDSTTTDTSSSGSGSSGSGSGGGGSGSGSSGRRAGKDLASSSAFTGIEYQVKGRVSGYVSSAGFVVRGTGIDTSGKLVYDRGDITSVNNGACIWVQGGLAPSSAGSVIRATRIRVLDNDCQ